TGESAKETVKTIARGMPGCSGEPVVTTSCAFLFLHARLRAHRALGIPCALCFGPMSLAKLGRFHAARSRRCSPSSCLSGLFEKSNRRAAQSVGPGKQRATQDPYPMMSLFCLAYDIA